MKKLINFLLFKAAGHYLYLDYIRMCVYAAYKGRWSTRTSFSDFKRMFYSVRNGTIRLWAKEK